VSETHNNDRLPRNQLLIGDARSQLALLPSSSVDCVITSPPYFALRDYGHPDQLGLETTVDEWVRELLPVCREIRRVLKPTGGLWLNVGDSYSHHAREGAPKKSLLLGPQRLALALVADGWVLRNHVVWAKTNPLPSNVTDRLSNTHESVFFFTKERRYFFDLNAIREPHKDDRPHGCRTRKREQPYPPVGQAPRQSSHADGNGGLQRLIEDNRPGHPLGKNPGDVWSLGTASYHGEHFATFPARLIERPIRATCPEQVCAACGTPWLRAKQNLHGRWLAVGALKPDCACGSGSVPGVVLDPFMGTGTTALVAEQHGRDWVGVELNPEYAALAEKRLAGWREQQRTKSKEV
jgi:site-specific DNA-methyltransferase (adenine-specific)